MDKNYSNPRQTTFIEFLKGSLSLIVFVFSSQIFTFLLLFPPPFKKNKRKKVYKSVMKWYAKLVIKTHYNINCKVINPHKEDLTKPAVIICNHQSILDVPATVMLSKNILMITNKWSKHFLYKLFLNKYIETFSTSEGATENLEHLRNYISNGYSIVIFPEALRFPTQKIERFHKGAFYLAEVLQLDILPVFLFGNDTINTNRKFYFKTGDFTINVFPRIKPDNISFGKTYQERTKNIQKFYRDTWQSYNQV